MTVLGDTTVKDLGPWAPTEVSQTRHLRVSQILTEILPLEGEKDTPGREDILLDIKEYRVK